MFTDLHTFAISLIMGLLIGLEREQSHPEGTKTFGVRTFILFSLLGSFAALLNQPLLAFSLSFFVFGVILLGYWRGTAQHLEHPNLGITTEVAAAIVFCLGYLTLHNPMMSAIMGSVVLLVLIEKKRLHAFSHETLRPREIEALSILLILMLILPLLPNRTIDSWQLFNPRALGLLISMIALIQFGGYVAMRLLGNRIGMSLMGFFGGLISSTAVFANLPQTLQAHPAQTRSTMAVGLLSTIAMLAEVGVILFVASRPLFFAVIWPISAMIAVGSIASFFLMRTATASQDPFVLPRNPLNILAVLRLSLFIGAMITLVALAKHYVGSEGTFLISFLGGLFAIQGVMLATAVFYVSGKLPLLEASWVLMAAILATFVSKFFLLWTLTPRRFALYTSLLLLGLMAAGGVVFMLFI